MSGSIRVERQGALGFIVFDHVERRNAISVDMWKQLPGAVAELGADPAVRVIILRGAGELAFVSGADISEFQSSRSGEAAAQYDVDSALAFDALKSLDKPLLTLIHGFCVGGGVAIALTADLRFAADDAVFAVPAARLGLGYHTSGIEDLVQVVGFSRAQEIFFTARRFTAAEARHMGLVNDVFPKAELESKVIETAQRIADNAPLTVRSVKISVRELKQPQSHRDFDRVNQSIVDCFASRDYAEGISAFLEKRPPQFRGE